MSIPTQNPVCQAEPGRRNGREGAQPLLPPGEELVGQTEDTCWLASDPQRAINDREERNDREVGGLWVLSQSLARETAPEEVGTWSGALRDREHCHAEGELGRHSLADKTRQGLRPPRA